MDTKIIEDGINEFKNNFKPIIHKQPISDFAKTELQNFVQHIMDLAFSSSTVEYDYFYKYIISLENKFLNDSKITKKDKQVILRSTSIARYSLHFWNDYYNKYEKNDDNKQQRKWWQWTIVGVCDVVGGIAGASTGPATAVTTTAAASTAAHSITNPRNK